MKASSRKEAPINHVIVETIAPCISVYENNDKKNYRFILYFSNYQKLDILEYDIRFLIVDSR